MATLRSRKSIGDLALESAMIVLSVLLALAASRWVDSRKQQQLAAQALASFDRELGGGGMWVTFGVYPAILRRLPLYAPYRDQPHFKRIVDNMIVLRKARG